MFKPAQAAALSYLGAQTSAFLCRHVAGKGTETPHCPNPATLCSDSQHKDTQGNAFSSVQPQMPEPFIPQLPSKDSHVLSLLENVASVLFKF